MRFLSVSPATAAISSHSSHWPVAPRPPATRSRSQLPPADGVDRRTGRFADDAGGDQDREPERLPLRELDPRREEQVLREGFAGQMAGERAAGLLDRCAAWQPDLFICDETDFGAMVAAERVRLPYASVLVTLSGSFVRTELLSRR